MANERTPSAAMKIEAWLNDGRMLDRLGAALSGYLDARTFAAQCVLATKDAKLADCSAESLFEAFLVCAQMGLLPGKHHGHVALIARRDRDRGNVVDVMPQWQGYKFLMERQQGVKRVTPMLVHVVDEFAWDAVDNALVHRFDPFDEARVFLHPADAGEGGNGLRGGYLRIEHDDGELRFHFVTAAKIEAARACSQVPDLDKYNKPGPWRAWYTEQAIKTVIRDAWARRAVTIDPILADRLGSVIERDDAALGNNPDRGLISQVVGQSTTPALTHKPARPVQTGMAGLRQRVGVPVQQPPADPMSQQPSRPVVDQRDVCPVCGSHQPSLRGQMTEQHGCPDCNGKRGS